MTIQEFYVAVGGDYNEVLRRLGNEKLIRRVLDMMRRNDSMEALRAALSARDYAAAFRACHTLKGVVLNLGLGTLTQSVTALTEALRLQTENDQVAPLFEQVEEQYAQMQTAIESLTAQE